MVIALASLNSYFGQITFILLIPIVIFNFVIFIISRRELEKDFINSHNNLDNIKNIKH